MTDRKPFFKRENIIKLQRLLNMNYKPAEIAAEIDVNIDTVYRSYLPAGAPHERDKNGNIWIHGVSFREWAYTIAGARKRKKYDLKAGEGWCMRCNRPVEILNPRIKSVNRYISMNQGTCPKCGGKVNRAFGAKTASAENASRMPGKAPKTA